MRLIWQGHLQGIVACSIISKASRTQRAIKPFKVSTDGIVCARLSINVCMCVCVNEMLNIMSHHHWDDYLLEFCFFCCCCWYHVFVHHVMTHKLLNGIWKILIEHWVCVCVNWTINCPFKIFSTGKRELTHFLNFSFAIHHHLVVLEKNSSFFMRWNVIFIQMSWILKFFNFYGNWLD